MRKNALIVCCFVCAFGAFGAFFRWLQNQIAFDPVTKVTNPSLWNVMVPLVIIAAAVVFFFLLRRVLGELAYPETMYETFKGTTVIHSVVSWVIGGMVIIGGLVTLLSTALDPQAGILRLISLLMILCGVSFPAICKASKRHFSPNLISIFSSIPIVGFVLWLVACYMRNSSVPNLWGYGIEIIAVSTVIIAFYYNAGFAFGKPRPKTALLASMLAAFMCLMSLADSRYMGMQTILFGTAAMLLMYCWMIVGNMHKPEAETTAAEPEEPVEISEPEPESEEETVIPAGEKVVTPEPTIQAPSRRDSEVDTIINEFKND